MKNIDHSSTEAVKKDREKFRDLQLDSYIRFFQIWRLKCILHYCLSQNTLYLMNACFLYYLEISEAAFSNYIRPHARCNVAAVNIEDLSRKTVIV